MQIPKQALLLRIVIGEDDSKTVRVVPPEVIRGLPDWRALVLRSNLNPVVVSIRPAWKRLAYRLGSSTEAE